MATIVVRPNDPGYTHHVSLAGAGRTFGIRLQRGAKSIQEGGLEPSNIQLPSGAAGAGDFDPAFGHIAMHTWEGGRGGEFLSENPTKYFDGYGWSMTPGVWHQAPQWWYGEFNGPSTAASTVAGSEAADNFLPGALRSSAGYSVLWNSMASTTHVARSFRQQGSSYIMQRTQVWVRKFGTPPAPLNLRIMSSASTAGGAGRPASSAASGTTAQLNSTDVESLESFLWTASLTTASTQSGTTTLNWWVELWTSVAGTDVNHWEIGYNSSVGVNSTGLTGTGTSGGWSAASTLNFYFRVAPNRTDRRLHLFTLDRALYAIEEKADGSTGTKAWINGDRGICSSVTPGSTAAINDSSKVWATNRWVDARVAIIRGPGAGQNAAITANGSTSLTVSLAQAPTSQSEYVIYDTNEWTKLSSAIVDTSAGDNPVRDITVGNNMAFLAFGDTTNIGTLAWATSVHAARKQSTFVADVLHFFSDPVLGPRLWRGISSLSALTAAPAQDGLTTAFTFSTLQVRCGGTDYRFTNLGDYNDQLYAFKEESIWIVRGERSGRLNIGLDGFPSSNTGRGIASQNLFLYFTWSHSLEKFQSGLVDDVGTWRGAGLKDGHQGPHSALVPYLAWTLGAIDAGTTGRSAAMALAREDNWHEFFRSPTTGARVESMQMQSNPGARPRLWMSVGGEIMCQRWPINAISPRADGGVHYQHECVMETATIDMGAAQLPKLFSKIHAGSLNLASTAARIYCEYQTDDDVGTTSWLPLGSFTGSPIDSLKIRRGNQHAIRLRVRGLTYNSTVPSELNSLTLKALARTPTRRQWILKATAGDFQVDAQGLNDADPDEFYSWLRQVSLSAEPLLMRSVWEAMDDIYVFIEQPSLQRLYTTPEGEWGGELGFTVREMEDG